MKMVNILIATPCYGGMLCHTYLHAVIKMKELLAKYGIQCTLHTIAKESLITRGRGYFVSLFLTLKEFTHLFFIDSDISFDAEAVMRMILADKDIIAGIYPKKNVDFKRIIETYDSAIKSGHNTILPQATYDYCINLEDNSNIVVNNGVMEALYVGTGFMLIKRNVIEKMVEAFPDTKYKNDVEGYFMPNEMNKDNFYMLFDCIIDPQSRRYLSEDFTFCYRWRQLGGKIHVDINCDLTHSGIFDWVGSFKTIFTPISSASTGSANVQTSPHPLLKI